MGIKRHAPFHILPYLMAAICLITLPAQPAAAKTGTAGPAATEAGTADPAADETAAEAAKTGGISDEGDQVAAVDPVGQSEDCAFVLYDNRNGLPTSEANDIAETADGFIWIGSYSGLVRHDGHTFERVSSTTGIGNVGCLFVDSRDRLWIGTNDSGLAMRENGTYRMWGEEDGLHSSKVTGIAETPDGVIYISTVAGIQTIGEDLTLTDIEDTRIKGLYVEGIEADGQGRIYGINSEDDIFILQDGKVRSYLRDADNEVHGIIHIKPDPAHPGKVYMGTEDSRFYYGTITDRINIEKTWDIAPLAGVMDIEIIDGRVWITGLNGIGALDGDTVTYQGDLLMYNSIGHVMKDYQGNLWFTSTRQGVMKVVRSRFEDVSAKYDLPVRVVNTTCLRDDLLFIGTDRGLIILNPEERMTEFPLSSAVSASGEDLGADDLLTFLDRSRIRSIIRDSKNRLWISTWRSSGLLCLDGDRLTAYTDADGLISTHIRAVSERSDGSMLVVNSGGVNIIDDGKVTATYTEADGIRNPESLTVAENTNGDILLGSNGGGIYVIGKDGTRCIGTEDGLSSGIIMRIKRDDKRNLFWIVTSNSLAYMTFDYEVTTIREFPYSNNFDLYENSRGEMWILSSNGIYALSAEELLSGEAVRPVHYGIANGLPCITTSNSYSELTPDGDLYISGNRGVVRVNIDRPMEDIMDLKVTVPWLDADGERILPDASGTFRIRSDVHKLTVYSYVINYALTDPMVSCQLEGFDREAATLNGSELGPLAYTNLPGGSYHYVISLYDSQGNLGQTISVPIVKERAFYERIWFYLLIALAFFSAAGALAWLYIRRKTRIMEEKNLEAVRKERLSTELQMGSRIQEGMLVHDFPPFPDRTEFDVYASMKPAREVGGDFYDIFLIDEDHLCLVMADVSGKGIPAALFMMVSKVILQSCAMLGQSAGEILNKMNEAICSNNKAEMFITVWVGILEISTGRISAANAGHEYPVLRRADGSYEIFKDKHGLVIGAMEDAHYEEYQIDMKPGDSIFLYTDGVPEATVAGDEMFGIDRLLAALNTEPAASPARVLDNVTTALKAFVGDAEQFDDCTMLCMEYKGK